MAKGIINSDDIATLKDRVAIEDVVGEIVTLRRVGALYRGLCPFHDDSRPSFDVSPERKMYICRSQCGSGDVFSFIQKTKNMTFVESVEFLADKIGMQLRYTGNYDSEAPSKRKELISINKEAMQFFKKQIKTNEAREGMKYLSERGFTDEHIEEFDIGYAPNGWDTLLNHLKSKGHKEADIIDAGLAIKNDSGKVYDRFRDRLTWTIFNGTGEPVGFGARKLSESDQGPKWLNTPETSVYRKSEVLYGLSKAKSAIAKDQIAVIVEGYGDVMACHLSDVPYAVATCGTAFAGSHVNIIRRLIRDGDSYKGKVIFTFDGDEAGKQAALRVFMKDNAKFISQTYVAVAPEGMDPLDLRIKHGPAAVKALIDNAVPLVEFVIEQRLNEYPLNTSEDKVNAMRAVLPVLKDIKDPILQQEYMRKLAGSINLSEKDVKNAFDAYLKNNRNQEQSYPTDREDEPLDFNSKQEQLSTPNPRDLKLRDERELIKALYQSPENHSVDLYGGAFISGFYAKLFDLYNSKPLETPASSFIEATYRGEPEETFIAEILMDQITSGGSGNLGEHIEALANNILFADTERKILEKRNELKTLKDEAKTLELVNQIVALENFKRSLRK
jgi:DNA primase